MSQKTSDFQQLVWDYYAAHGRHDLSWRVPNEQGFDPYAIMVSEIMLQQTQVNRVIPKFQAFMTQFPTIEALAASPLAAVLEAWSGLGYNRRAKFLWQAAQMVVQDFGGQMPRTVDELMMLPGVGKNTAGAIAAYAYDAEVVFIETNIRTVFIHHFFADDTAVRDDSLEPLIRGTVEASKSGAGRSPRTWYWALMDYGTHLKQTVGNVGRRSATYAKQSAFAGSRRQIRGKVLSLVRQPMNIEELQEYITDERLVSVLDDLVREKLISCVKNTYTLGAP